MKCPNCSTEIDVAPNGHFLCSNKDCGVSGDINIPIKTDKGSPKVSRIICPGCYKKVIYSMLSKEAYCQNCRSSYDINNPKAMDYLLRGNLFWDEAYRYGKECYESNFKLTSEGYKIVTAEDAYPGDNSERKLQRKAFEEGYFSRRKELKSLDRRRD